MAPEEEGGGAGHLQAWFLLVAAVLLLLTLFWTNSDQPRRAIGQCLTSRVSSVFGSFESDLN